MIIAHKLKTFSELIGDRTELTAEYGDVVSDAYRVLWQQRLNNKYVFCNERKAILALFCREWRRMSDKNAWRRQWTASQVRLGNLLLRDTSCRQYMFDEQGTNINGFVDVSSFRSTQRVLPMLSQVCDWLVAQYIEQRKSADVTDANSNIRSMLSE